MVDRALARCVAQAPRRALGAALAALSLLLVLAPPSVARGEVAPRPLGPPLAGVELVLERGGFRAGPPGLDAPRHVWLAASASPVARGSRWFQPLAAGAEVGYALRDGLWSYDLALPAGVDLEVARFAIEGALSLFVAPAGALELRCVRGRLEHSAPRAWIVEADGYARETAVRFVRRGAFEVAFEVPERTRGQALRIDPGLRWSAAWGGSGDEVIHALARAADGDWIVCGETRSLDLGGTAGALQPRPGGGGDAFVARLAGDGGVLRWATYLGGSGEEVARAVCVAPDGAIYVAGGTSSTDFPTTSASLSRALGGPRDAFLAAISGDGRALLASTYAGGSGADEARACAWVIDHPAIAGVTSSSDLPTHAAAFQRAPRAARTASCSSSQPISPGWSPAPTSEARRATKCKRCSSTASSCSVGRPSPRTSRRRRSPGSRRRAARISSSRVPPLGSSRPAARPTSAAAAPRTSWRSRATARGASRSPPAAARTISRRARGRSPRRARRRAHPTPTSPCSTPISRRCSRVAISAEPASTARARSRSGRAASSSSPGSRSPRTSRAPRARFQTAHASLVPFARHDAWVARLDAELRTLTYASFLGGSAAELAPRLSWDPEGDALVALATNSLDFPSAGAPPPPRGAGLDLAAARIDLLPSGMRRYGRASAGPRATPLLWANEPPRAASTSFRLGLRGGGAHAAALHLFSPRAAAAPWSALGLELWLDPAPPAFALAFACDASGSFDLPLAAPPGLAGQRVHVQSLSFDLASQSLASSAAYELELR
ncbi:MAG: hypothetical protein IPN34_07490 [Planctomycetes bacterium]|nr:hypothetical protein [Planctomycetota bacterium]